MAANVSIRMALALPVFRIERFCGVMPILTASSQDLIFRRASMTSRLIRIGIGFLDCEVLILLQFASFLHDPGDDRQDAAQQ